MDASYGAVRSSRRSRDAGAAPIENAERGRRYAEAIARLSDAYFVLGRDALFLEVNDALCALLRRPRAELIGASPLALMTRDSAVLLAQTLATVETTRFWTNTFEFMLPDGGCVPVSIRALNHRDAHGEVESSHGFVTDLSEIVHAQRAVADSERELRGILDNLQDTYYRTDLAGQLVRVSRAIERLLGYTCDEVVGRRVADFCAQPGDLAGVLQQLRAQGGSLSNVEGRLRHRDGREVFVSSNVRLLRDEEGHEVGIEGTTRDITDLRRARERLALAARVFDSAGEAIVITSPDLRVVAANPAFTDRTGWSSEEAFGRSAFEYVSAVDAEQGETFPWVLKQALEGAGTWSGEVHCRRRDGEGLAAWLSASRVGGEAPGERAQAVLLLSDLSERKASQQRIAFLAHHDPLTELPNRVLFRERVELAIAGATRSSRAAALLFVDVDEFKRINDTHGHAAGDQVLREIARRLRTHLRATDSVGRHGGDEFAVVLADLPNAAAAQAAADVIRGRLAAPIRLGGAMVRVTCTVGIALFPEHGDDYESLLRKADEAMYAGKRAGRDRVSIASEGPPARPRPAPHARRRERPATEGA